MIAGYDIETTGLKWGDHRIIELAVLRYEDDGAFVDKMVQRIDPRRAIDPDAERVHKIGLSDLVGMPVWSDVAPKFLEFINEADLIVAHNGDGFDGPFTNFELERIGLPKLKPRMFDTLLKGRWATPNGAVPSLKALCFACGFQYDIAAAHAAEYDVERMMECFFFGHRTGFFSL